MSHTFDIDVSTPRKRGHVILQALIFTPLALLMLAGVVLAAWNIAFADSGYVVMLFVAGIMLLLFGFQAVLYLRDISATLALAEGEVSKRWSKGNFLFFLFPGYYIAVKGRIYRLSRPDYSGLLEEDMVRIHHFPHSLTVELIERYDETEKKFVPADDRGNLQF